MQGTSYCILWHFNSDPSGEKAAFGFGEKLQWAFCTYKPEISERD